MVPLSAFTSFGPGTTPLAVNHQGPFVATTFSFNLPEGEPLSVALAAIQHTMAQLNVPISVHGDFAGTANLYQASLANEPILILAAIVTIYIVLGVLYESYVHPLTILSTLPSAGVGAVLALLALPHGFQPDRPDRPDPADRHREEERHHHDRLRHRGAAPGPEPRARRSIAPACCASGPS